MFPQAVPRLVFGLAMLWAWLNIPIPIYGTIVAVGVGLFHGAAAIGRADPGRCRAADRQEPRGMRPRLRRLLGLSAAHRDPAVVAARHRRGLAAAVHRQRARARRVDFSGRAQCAGHRAVHRQRLAQLLDRIVGGVGADPDLRGVRGAGDPVPRGAAVSPENCRERSAASRCAISSCAMASVTAVNGVSFKVGRGEHVTLLGPSGCGKTTTLRAIAGLEEPSAGAIRIDGQTMYSAAERRNVPAEKRGISMVFQSYAVWPHMTVFDNVAYGLRVRKLPRAEVAAQCRARPRPGADARIRRPAGLELLSGGQQQRVALARAIAFSPTVRAVRRAAQQPRRQAAGRDARRIARIAAPARHHLGLCHARPGGGAGDLRPGHRHEQVAGSSRSAPPRRSTTVREAALSPISSARPI